MRSRRLFLQQAGLMAAGLMINPSNIFGRSSIAARGGTNTLTQIGLQLYTLRDQLAKDVKGTISQVAKIGYNHVETFSSYPGAGKPTDFWGLDAKGLKALLKQNNLPTHSGHYQLNDFLTRGNGNDEALKAQLEVAHTLGQEYLVVPVPPAKLWDKMTGADYQFMAAQLNKAGDLAKKAGIKIGYHNHYWEFKQQADVKKSGYDVLLSETNAALVHFELDIFWATKAGADPISLFSKYPGRFAMWHVKDIDKSAPETIVGGDNDSKSAMQILPHAKFAEVGTGLIDFKKIFAKASEAGAKYAFVEQDQITIDHFKSIEESYTYVKKSLLK
jgi:sugar phosphate isomerase/epimerase